MQRLILIGSTNLKTVLRNASYTLEGGRLSTVGLNSQGTGANLTLVGFTQGGPEGQGSGQIASYVRVVVRAYEAFFMRYYDCTYSALDILNTRNHTDLIPYRCPLVHSSAIGDRNFQRLSLVIGGRR